MTLAYKSQEYNRVIEIEENKIEKLNKIKYLEVLAADKLNFKDHFNLIIKKVTYRTNFIKRISKGTFSYVKIQLYKTNIAPYFDYCSILFLPNNERSKFQKLLNKAMRDIIGCNQRTPISFYVVNITVAETAKLWAMLMI